MDKQKIFSKIIGCEFSFIFVVAMISAFVTEYVGVHFLVGAFIAGLSAIRLSLISSCLPCRVSLFILAVLVLFTTFSAWWCVKNGNVKAHQQFMVRSYICILSFVAVRIGGIIPLDFLFGQIEDPTFGRTVNEYFFSFVPIICGEIFMIWIPTLKNIKRKKNRINASR